MPRAHMTNDAAHELALTIINDGKGYQRRKNAGDRMLRQANNGMSARINAGEWVAIATEGARQYEREYGSPGASCFTVQDILIAAWELADYYEQHARENAALEDSNNG